MSLTYLKKDNKLLQQLLEFLKEGGFQDGDRIPSERTLAKEFNISRNSLREVLKILQTMDVLEIREKSGIYIHSISNLTDNNTQNWSKWISLQKNKVLDLHNVRTALEVKAIELIPTIELETVGAKLKECISQIDIESCSVIDFINHDICFHDIIWRACNNKVLLEICLDITNTIYDERIVIASDETRKKTSYAEHNVIADSFLSYDLSFIKKICEAHYGSVNNYLKII